MSPPDLNDVPEPGVSQPAHWHVSLIWLVPVIAALVGLGLVARDYLQAGPTIEITFETAEGLTAKETEVRYKNVVVGKVARIRLAEDREQVTATVELSRDAARLAAEDSRFWVVRPRVDLGGVSGLATLVSGAYIGVDVGTSKTPGRRFQGLETPPTVTRDQKGRRFLLRSPDLGSLAVGSPVYYRRVAVGRVAGYELAEDGQGVTVQVFVAEPYDRFVTADTRFWNASGLDLSLNAEGIRVNTQSLATVVLGGVAFQARAESRGTQPAAEDHLFTLHPDIETALRPPDGEPLEIRMRFVESTRGLAPGATVDFQGVDLGRVTSIGLNYDPDQKAFSGDVVAEIFPERLGRAYVTLRQASDGDGNSVQLVRGLVGQGLRAQLRVGNLLTSQLYVALDFKPEVEATLTGPEGAWVEIPTAPGALDQIQQQIADIVDRLEAIPFDEIGNELNQTLQGANGLMRQLRDEIAPELNATLDEIETTLGGIQGNLTASDAPIQAQTRETLEEVGRAARSLRTLSDYLQRHPESLLRGKPDREPEPAAEASP